MTIDLDVVPYSPAGITTHWRNGHVIRVTPDGNGGVHVCANREGLLTLAQHLVTLALPGVPAGSHIHYDSASGLEDDSVDLIVELGGE
jgi:hypothetical protein